ncbi:MAG: SPOR domain-containing protein [Microbacterium sp.]
MSDDNDKFWYNLTNGRVERGFESPAIDRAGPFDTAEEAANAPELIRERSRQWAEDDAREQD